MKKLSKTLAKTAAITAAGGASAYAAIKAAKFREEKKEYTPFPEEKVNLERYMNDLSDAIKIESVSNPDPEKVDWEKFERFHTFLEERYPLVNMRLSREIIARGSLLYYLEGSDKSLKPIAMLAHMDVVPVSRGTEQDWTYPAFSGHNDGEFIWGRGSLDMKNQLIGVMEALEELLEEGFTPARGIYLCFGHDEEVMSTVTSGAVAIVNTLRERGIQLEAVLDEGGAILKVNVPGVIRKNLAGVGIAEKGYADFDISINAKGGHSSQPPKHTALGEMADVIKDIENNQFESRLTPMIYELLMKIGKNVSFPAKLITSHIPSIKPLIVEIMNEIPPAASMIRTTTAVTMASGSPSENVLPQKASINVNFRIMPGETIEDVEKHLKKIIRNKKAVITFKKGKQPSNISRTDSKGYKTIEEISKRMNPSSVVAPYLVMGATDACHYERICDSVYRFSPFQVSTSLLLTTHATNERIPIASIKDGILFFKRYMRLMTE